MNVARRSSSRRNATSSLIAVGLAAFEMAIGICFVAGIYRKLALPLLIAHMLGTGLPFFMFPSQLFADGPLVPILLGQYILKNIIIISAAIVLMRRWR